jgi:serine/threonine protein kinase
LLARRYHIVRLIGSGGVGEVYEAEDSALGLKVALKTLSATVTASAIALERFRREILLSRRVTHPNVCRTIDLGEHEWRNGQRITFLTMELLSGRSLADLLRGRGRRPYDEALAIATQIADGLQAAHDAGVIHRDLKPGNILLETPAAGGVRVVITDFGLARGHPTDQLTLTASDELLGTPLYMSPEQVESPAGLTPATDIYSFGIVLYEMITGQLPFTGIGISVALQRLTTPPVPVRQHLPDVDPVWETVLHRCLARDPKDRFASARDVAAALTGQPSPAPSTPARNLGRLFGKALSRKR